MKEPNITEEIGGYKLMWPETALQIKVKRLDIHSDGRVTGDLEILNSNLQNPAILLPPSQFNFASERTRSQQAKSLKEKYGDAEVNWTELFDYLGYKIQELARRGEPAEEIWADDEAEAPKLLLPPIIYRGVPNIIYGPKGVNKSTLCYTFAACLVLPWDNNPLELDVPQIPVKSLVLDWETDKGIFKYYLAKLMRGMNIPQFPIYYRRCRLPLAEEIEAVAEFIVGTGAEVLIIDSLAAAAGGGSEELKGSQAALSFNSSLRKLKDINGNPITSLIIAQTSKDNESSSKTIYGSVLFTYYARNIFELCRGDDENSTDLHLGLFHRENNFGRKHSPMGFCLHYNDSNMSMSIKREPININEFMEKVSINTRILDLLKKTPMTKKDICDKLGKEVKENSVQKALGRLEDNEKIIKVGEKWGLIKEE